MATKMQTFHEFLEGFTHTPLEYIPDTMAVSDVLLKASTDDERRTFEGWGTVEIKDRQGDLIPIEAFEPLMKKLMKRGAPILDSHSNRHVGKVLDYKFKQKNGKKGLWLKGEIFDDFSSDDQVWSDIKLGLITGFSLGGRAQKQALDCDYTSGECVNKIEDLEVWEWSVVRKPANPEATIESVNKLAKADELAKKMSWDECVRQMKEQYGSEDKAYAVCNGLASEGKVEPCPERKMMEKMVWEYVNKKPNITKLSARAMLEKCTPCKAYVELLKAVGVDEDIALMDLQKKLDNIVEEKRKMASVNVKLKPDAPQIPEEEKQEEGAVDESGKNAAILQEILKRLAQIEEVVFPKETSMDAEEEHKEESEEEKDTSEIKEAVAKELKKFFDKLGVSSTQRPLEKSAASTSPSPEINLKDLSFADLARLRLEADPIWQKIFLRYDTR